MAFVIFFDVRDYSIHSSTVSLHVLSSQQTTRYVSLSLALVFIWLCSLMDKSPVHHLKAYMWNNINALQIITQSKWRSPFHICTKAARLAFAKCSLMLCVLQPADAFQHTWKPQRVGAVGKWKRKIDVCALVRVCEEDDGCPIFGKRPFFLFDSAVFISAGGPWIKRGSGCHQPENIYRSVWWMLNRQHRHHKTPGSDVTALSGSRSVRLHRGNTSVFDPMCDILLLQQFWSFVLFSNSGRCCWLKCWLTHCVFGKRQSCRSTGNQIILPAGPTGFFCCDKADIGVIHTDLGSNETPYSLHCRLVLPIRIHFRFSFMSQFSLYEM